MSGLLGLGFETSMEVSGSDSGAPGVAFSSRNDRNDSQDVRAMTGHVLGDEVQLTMPGEQHESL